jgi:hypothetical protein
MTGEKSITRALKIKTFLGPDMATYGRVVFYGAGLNDFGDKSIIRANGRGSVLKFSPFSGPMALALFIAFQGPKMFRFSWPTIFNDPCNGFACIITITSRAIKTQQQLLYAWI